MPLIGSSSVSGMGKGPTGDTGNSGPIGPIGNSGITKGETGATGIFISRVVSDRENDTIVFYTSDGSAYSLNGFRGPSSLVYGVSGISASINSSYYSPFIGVSSGLTLNFIGISAGNNVSVTSNSEKVFVNINSSSGSYGLVPKLDHVVFTDNPYLKGTNIFVDENDILNFGLTGIPTGITYNTLFSTINEDINYINSVVPSSNGGIILDLKKSSNHWLETPMGITAFSGISLSGIRQEYTLFFNGSNVWNLPNNLYFENDQGGIKNYAFLDGVNILHIWSENGGVTFNGNFIERGLGASGPFYFTNIGSCCYKKYGYRYCTDGVDQRTCDSLGGIFEAFTNCSSRTSIDECGVRAGHNIRGETGACCCGVTGCFDNSPGGIDPSVAIISRNLCENIIGGKFYPKKECSVGDKWPAYGIRPIDGNTAANIFCHKPCIDPVACYRVVNGVGICSQETVAYCDEIGGDSFINKLCGEIDQIGGGAELTREGWCYKFGVCSDLPNVKKYECTPCGHWNQTFCDTQPVIPVSKTVITTPNPLIKIVHSVSSVDDENVTTTYSDRDPTLNSLSFQVVQETVQKHTLYGIVKILDTSIAGQTVFNIWDLNPRNNTCFNVNVFDEDGLTLTENSFIERDRRYFLQIKGVPSKCVDTDFKAEIYLALNSCVGGFTLTTKSDTVPIIYTRSPCTCIAIDSSQTVGDVLNKAPITIPYVAERFCLDCTKRYSGFTGDKAHISHIPYPLKKQSGIITFCPPTENFEDNPISICTNSEGFCVSYGIIEDINGCTYSSLFDSNGDGKIFNETNTAPNNCYHAEYNVPGEGTTYYYTGLSNQNIRTCETRCKVRTHYGSTSDELYSLGDCSSRDCNSLYDTDCCGAFTTTRLNTLANCKTCAGNNESITGPCSFVYANPYFNRVHLDTNALYDIGQKYNININELEKNVINVIERKNLLFNPNFIGVGSDGGPYGITTSDSGVGGATIERRINFYGGGGVTLNPDPDDRAKTSCITCSGFFDKTDKIRVPKLNPDGAYDVYGLVLEKENICLVEEKKTNPQKFNETNIDRKYYILIKKIDNSCYLIYDIANQTIINSPIKDLQLKFFNYNSLCSLNCEDYTASIKEVKWLGTVGSSYRTPIITDRCQDSVILNYTLNKDIEEKLYTSDKINDYKISDLVTFSGLNYSSSEEVNKNKELASLLLSIFNGTLNQHKLKQCSLCSGDDCYSDIIQNLSEFIGVDCNVDGISGSVGNAEFYSASFSFIKDPIKVPFNPSLRYKEVSAGFHCTIGITAGGPGISGGFTGWGRNHLNMLDGFASAGSTYTKVSAGANCVCAIRGVTYTSAVLVCKGDSKYSNTIYPQAPITGVKDVSVGYAHTVWIDSTGGLSFTNSIPYSPYWDGSRKIVTSLPKVKSISSGKFHSCAILDNNGITCWGDNFFNQCSVPSGLTASAISCGGHHTLALLGDGTLRVWGITAFGLNTVPTDKYNKITAGYLHNCGIKTDGTVRCWGYTYDGQCNSPTGQYVSISAGREHTVALDSSGGITCWGVIGDDGICASFEDKTLIVNDNPKLRWLKEGTDYADLSPSIIFKNLSLPTLYYDTKVSGSGLTGFVDFDAKFYSSVFVGGLYLVNQQIKKQKKLLFPPSSDISFYYLSYAIYKQKPSGSPNIDSYSLSFYDVIYDYNGFSGLRTDENKGIILKKRIPRLDVSSFRNELSLSNVKTYLNIVTDNPPEGFTSYYQPIITFNLKQTQARIPVKVGVFEVVGENIVDVTQQYYMFDGGSDELLTLDLQGLDEFDTNKYIIRGKRLYDTTHPSLNFRNKYLLVYSQGSLSSYSYYNNINFYPGLTFGFEEFKTLFLDRIGNSNSVKTSNFDIKPIPLQETGQEFAGYILMTKDTTSAQRKDVNGVCLEIDCSKMPEFCSGYRSC